MIVRLSHPQILTVSNRVPELHRAMIAAHWVKRGRSSRDVCLPAIAWRQILDHLVETSYGPLGGKLDRMPQSVYSAIAAIQEMVMRMEHHPALRHQGMMGYHGEVIPAWRSGGSFTCYPADAQFVLLEPDFRTNRGSKVTMWTPTEPSGEPEGATYREDFHLLFVGEIPIGAQR